LLNPREALLELQEGQLTIQENWAVFSHNGALNKEENDIISVTEELFPRANMIISQAATIFDTMGTTLLFDDNGNTLITDYNGDLFE
jgi:methyl-accepting chemotaxis protein